MTQAAGSHLEGTNGLTIEEWKTLSFGQATHDHRRVDEHHRHACSPRPTSGGLRSRHQVSSDKTAGIRTTTFDFRMPAEIAARVRAASS